MKNTAIVLAAGRGSRLRPLTDRVPKCMVLSPEGVPLLHRTVSKLRELGVSDVVVGVGFGKESVSIPPMNQLNVHWVENREWETTNNIQTMRLCADYLKQTIDFDNVFIIEGDIYLGDKVLPRLLMESESATAVLPASYAKRGSCVAVDETGYVRILRDNRDWNDPSIFKLANVYKLTRADFLRISERLPECNKSQYYEAIIGELIGNVKLRAVIDGDCREIDNSYDKYNLEQACKLDYASIRSNWGGLWRRPVQDQFFLSNPFYPTPFIRDRLKHSLDVLISNYPSGRRRMNEMLRAFCNVSPDFPLYALNGACEGIGVLSQLFRERNATFSLRFSPTFGEYSRFALREVPETTGTIVVSPNNPTAEKTTLEEVRKLAGSYSYVILDLSLNIEKDTPYLDAIAEHPNLIVIKSLSKLMGIPGIRLGYVAVSERCIGNFESLLPIWNVNSIAEHFFELHLDSLSDYERSLQQWRNESRRVYEELARQLPATSLALSDSFISIVTPFPLAQPLYEDYGIFVADLSSKFQDGLFHSRVGIKTAGENDYLVYAITAICKAQSPARLSAHC